MSEKRGFLPFIIGSAMRLFFRLLYHSMAGTYDLVASTVSVGKWKDWVFEAAKLISGKRVLELGYGPGHLLEHLAAANLEVYGLDESRQMARTAARRLKKAKLKACISRGMAQNLPFPNLFFDSIVATFPTLYIVDPDTLGEIQRVLKPNGRLVVLMASWLTGKSIIERMMGYLFRVTGQLPDDQQAIGEFTLPYMKAGFQASLRFVNLPDSRLMFILATKQSGPDSYNDAGSIVQNGN
ncbi:MAG: methyltransferase domain-containing protein [Anaerolineaceae bacterium]|nr:methyltransferase domain-containing protein [Anaerolineaceae bacterium]